MRLIDTQWVFYSEAAVPWWGLMVVAIACIAMAIRWARIEVTRASLAARILPLTITLLLLLTAWLVYRPVLIRVSTWEHDGKRLAYLDTSDSMNEPFAGTGDVTAALDLLTIHSPVLVKERPSEAIQLRNGLALIIDSATQQQAALASVHEQLAQGVPLAESAAATQNKYGEWVSETKSRLRTLLGGAQLMAQTLPPQQAVPAAESMQLLASLSIVTENLRDGIGDLTPAFMQSVLAPLEMLLSIADDTNTAMLTLQSLSDAAFLATHEATLKPRIAEVCALSRSQVARDTIRAMRLEPVTLTKGQGPPAASNQTDLYGDLALLLDQHEGEVLSGLYVFSDGGHNGRSPATVLDDIRKAKIPTISVGTGSLMPGVVDLAILDWECRRIAFAGKDFTLKVLVKTAVGIPSPFRLTLSSNNLDLVSEECVATGKATHVVTLRAKAPKAGRHPMRLTLAAASDAIKRNNTVAFTLDTVERAPQAFIVGAFADWDTAYLTMAAQRNGIVLRQTYVSDSPRRGEAIDAVPNSAKSWSKYGTIVLKGKPFGSFSDTDANDLHQFVTQTGGSLLIFVDTHSYYDVLAQQFGWTFAANPLADAYVRMPLTAIHEPMLRLGVDGPQSAQILAALPPANHATRVPPQDAVLLTNQGGEPVLSVGSYGKGHVFLLGLRGLFAQRDFAQATRVDRLLTQLLAQAALPPSPGAQAASAMPATDRTINPGMEELFSEFNEPFMINLAKSTHGRYLPVAEAAAEVNTNAPLTPVTWRDSTAKRYPLADHWLLIAAITLIATIHWTLRKLAGLAI